MAVDDLDILRQELPEVFRDRALPSDWEEDWPVIPIEDPERFPSQAKNPPDFELIDDLVKSKAFRRPNDPKKRAAALTALEHYIKLCPSGSML